MRPRIPRIRADRRNLPIFNGKRAVIRIVFPLLDPLIYTALLQVLILAQ